MTNLLAILARYLMLVLIVVYSFYNLWYYRTAEEERDALTGRQQVCMVLILVLADTVAWLRTGDMKLLALCGAQLAFLLVYPFLMQIIYPGLSRLLMANVCMLMATGFIILNRISPDRALRQSALTFGAAAASLLMPLIIDRVWQLAGIPWLYGLGGLALLGAVSLVGSRSFGAQLSLRIGGFSFQPSEFVKLTFVFFVAGMFYRDPGRKSIAATMAVAAAHVLVLVFSRDLGSALIFFTVYILMLFAATGQGIWLFLGGAGGYAAAALALRLFPHVRTRVAAWRDPFQDITGAGYQVAQAMFAIGTGGWFGMGLYQGMPYKIPVVEKDFIFAAISEELGGIYALCLILICLGCFMQFMSLAIRMDASFYRLIALGLGVIYIVQVFLAIGGVIKFIPSTGVTLPFVSYGGSSVFSSFLMFSVVQGLYIMKGEDLAPEYDAEYDAEEDDPDA